MKLCYAIFTILIFSSCGSGESSKSVVINGIEQKTIPGLTAADIHLNFKEKGFVVTKNIGVEFSSWNCIMSSGLNTYFVMASGKGPSEIVSVDANYTTLGNFTNEGKEFLGYSASLPYKGANPKAAKEWTMRNLDLPRDTTIGYVKFRTIIGKKSLSLKLFID